MKVETTDINNFTNILNEQVGTFTTPPTGKVSVNGCIVRQATAGAGWSILNDSGHESIDISGALTVNVSGDLEIPFDTTYGQVGVIPVTPDETYAGLGIYAGGSIAFNKITVSAYQMLNTAVNLQTGNVTPTTFFVGRVSSTNNGNGTWTITHPSVGSNSVVPLISPLSGPYTPKLVNYTSTTVIIGTYAPLRFRVNWNGSAWVVTTNAFTKPTVTSFSGGTLALAYNQSFATAAAIPTVTQQKDSASVATGMRTTYSTTGLSVQFRDYAGTLLTTASTDMDIVIDVMSDVLMEVPLGQIALSRPNCHLNFSDVFSADGNFMIGPGLMVR